MVQRGYGTSIFVLFAHRASVAGSFTTSTSVLELRDALPIRQWSTSRNAQASLSPWVADSPAVSRTSVYCRSSNKITFPYHISQAPASAASSALLTPAALPSHVFLPPAAPSVSATSRAGASPASVSPAIIAWQTLLNAYSSPNILKT